MKNTKAIIKIIVCIILILFMIIPFLLFRDGEKHGELKSIKTEKELYKIYNDNYSSDEMPIWGKMLTLPFSLITTNNGVVKRASLMTDDAIYDIPTPMTDSTSSSFSLNGKSSQTSSSTQKDYSKTNIQVENVDEADITKTDGNYIYSISENNVVITDARNPEQVKVLKKFNPEEYASPVDLILNGNQLVVISQTTSFSGNTFVTVYDISDKQKPLLQKSYTVNKKYYTSRCINNKLYVISNGYLKKIENKKAIDREYTEDGQTKQIPLENIKYLEDLKDNNETIITVVDLKNVRNNIQIGSYLLDVTNAYVSENNIYLADYSYNYINNKPPVKSIFGLKGLLGIADHFDSDYSTVRETEIYKFRINDGNLEYVARGKVQGETINQYSMDEKNNHLRIASYDNEGTSITIFDETMHKIGQTAKLAKGEKMYSSRFIGNKAYLITYKQIDPLWVVDLSNEKNPQVLGELKISGYSAYLHPYDENHLIGIGMETKTTSNKDINGRVTSSSTRVVGMKMALFDISDFSNPTAIATTVIGDSRTTSAILTNPKALLFSKEKQLLAIPVNNYTSDFEVTDSSDLETIISSYKSYNKNYKGEGYAVYKINLTEGFKLKGVITHEKTINSSDDVVYSYYGYPTKQMLRGIYINNDLYTVSEDEIRVNNLETMKELSRARVKTNATTTTKTTNNSIKKYIE